MSKSMSAEDAKKAADDEKMRLLQKIKDNSNGPEQAKRAIVALDKMVNGLKKRRRLCGESIEEDTKRLSAYNAPRTRANASQGALPGDLMLFA